MKVTPSKQCMKRYWWPNVSHLKGQRMQVVHTEGEAITFLAEKGRLRTWHKSNLDIVKINLENK